MSAPTDMSPAPAAAPAPAADVVAPGGTREQFDAMLAATNDLERQLRALRHGQLSLRRVLVVGFLILVCELAAWSVASAAKARSNFQQARVRAELALVARDIGPRLLHMFASVRQEVGPTYAELAAERLRQIAPSLAHDIREQVQTLPLDFADALQIRVDANLAQLGAQARVRILAAFPADLDDAARTELTDDLDRKLKTQTDLAAGHVDQRYATDWGRIDTALARLAADDSPGQPPGLPKPADLERHWAHLMLQCLDHWLMSDPPVPPPAKPAAKEVTGLERIEQELKGK